MTCPYLDYRRSAVEGDGEGRGDSEGRSDDERADGDGSPRSDARRGHRGPRFEVERAFCTVVDEFVQPMRADVCHDRYDLSHASHCEYYREAEGLE